MAQTQRELTTAKAFCAQAAAGQMNFETPRLVHLLSLILVVRVVCGG